MGNSQETATEEIFLDVEASCDTREKPDGINGSLVDVELSCVRDDNLAINSQSAAPDLCLDLGDEHMGARDGDSRTDIQTLINLLLVELGCHVPERIEGDDLGGVRPLGLLRNVDDRLRVIKDGPVL